MVLLQLQGSRAITLEGMYVMQFQTLVRIIGHLYWGAVSAISERMKTKVLFGDSFFYSSVISCDVY
jgi:hypothetical protein